MTKTKQQLRAETVERLRARREKGNFIEHIELYAILLDSTPEEVCEIPNREVADGIIDLLTDDCGPCYSCARLAELMAENSQLRVMVDGMTRIDQDERLPRLADAETRVRELQVRVDELTEQLEDAEYDCATCAAKNELQARVDELTENYEASSRALEILTSDKATIITKCSQLCAACGYTIVSASGDVIG